VTAHRIQPQRRRDAVVARHVGGEAGEDVLHDRHPVLQVALELHAELGERATGQHHDVVVEAGVDERAGEHEGVHRSAAERLHVAAGRPRAARPLRDRLGHVAPAPLVAIAHRLLAAADDVPDVGGGEGARPRQQVAQRQARRGLAREVLEQDLAGERVVVVVAGQHGAQETAVHADERQRAVPLDALT
jgi:hypothetical protein